MSRTKHKFHLEQPLNTDSELFSGRVVVMAHLPDNCSEHDLPRYGCAAGDRHFTFCEMMLKAARLN